MSRTIHSYCALLLVGACCLMGCAEHVCFWTIKNRVEDADGTRHALVEVWLRAEGSEASWEPQIVDGPPVAFGEEVMTMVDAEPTTVWDLRAEDELRATYTILEAHRCGLDTAYELETEVTAESRN